MKFLCLLLAMVIFTAAALFPLFNEWLLLHQGVGYKEPFPIGLTVTFGIFLGTYVLTVSTAEFNRPCCEKIPAG